MIGNVLLVVKKYCLYSGTTLNRTLLGQSNMSVSSCQGFLNTQMMYLGLRKVSCLWRCPQFRGVLIEGFHCNIG